MNFVIERQPPRLARTCTDALPGTSVAAPHTRLVHTCGALLQAVLALAWSSAVAQPLVSVDTELTASGQNYDDVCFWRDPVDPDASLLFVTAKSAARVEVFRHDSGVFQTAIGGFQRPVNCDVTGDFLVTTDNRTGEIVVHHIPDFTEIARFGEGLSNPQGVTTLDRDGRTLVYVTDVWEGEVDVYDLASTALVNRFPTGLFHHEALAADELYGRVFVADDTLGEVTDESLGSGRVLVFTPEGEFLTEFGADVIGVEAEGIALYRCGAGGWIVVSDQRPEAPWSEFEVFERASLAHVGTFVMRNAAGGYTDGTDGLDIFQVPTRRFPAGVLAACDSCLSGGDDVDLAAWERIAAVFGLAVCPDGRPPGCGDGVQAEPFEECDGGDDDACPGGCGSACVCGTPVVSTTTTSSTTTRPPTTATSSTSSTTSTAGTPTTSTSSSSVPASSTSTMTLDVPQPCGDGIVDAPGEECDGGDDTACAGACGRDCRCLEAVGLVEADATVKAKDPAQNFGSSPDLWADADSPKRSFLQVRVSGVSGRVVRGARLELRVAQTGDAPSESGGRLRAMSDCFWDEATVTWHRQPEVDGPVLDQVGTVVAGAHVAFDVTAAVPGDGVYCFALESTSADGVVYHSREVSGAGPALAIEVANPSTTSSSSTSSTSTTSSSSTPSTSVTVPSTTTTTATSSPRCGDGVVNRPTEECDGTDDAACAGACGGECRCTAPTGIVDADATVMAAEPGRNFGGATELWADADTPKRALFRVRVGGVGRRVVTAAWLRLRVTETSKAMSETGGRLRAIRDCSWVEGTVTWGQQPVLDGPVLDEAGPVAHGDAVAFDVTAAVRGDGVYCFILESESADAVIYHAREAAGAGPAVALDVAGPTATSTTTSPTTSSTSSSTTAATAPPATTTTAPPRCGDGIVNVAGEACDGADDATCPGACRPDCRCAIPSAVVVADATVKAREPARNFGGAPELWADSDTAKRTFVRVQVTGIGRRPLARALLQLRVGETQDAASEAGGRVRATSDCGWQEHAVTWEQQPAVNGLLLDEVGPVVWGANVSFDVTAAITGDGVYCFTLESRSADGVMYHARESGAVAPRVDLVLAGD